MGFWKKVGLGDQQIRVFTDLCHLLSELTIAGIGHDLSIDLDDEAPADWFARCDARLGQRW